MKYRNAGCKEGRMTEVIWLQKSSKHSLCWMKMIRKRRSNSLRSEKTTSESVYYSLRKGLKEWDLQKLKSLARSKRLVA